MSKARDIADLDFNAPDIDGGNIDGATIGGTTPAAGTFTSAVATSSIVDNVIAKTSSGSVTFKNNTGGSIARFNDNVTSACTHGFVKVDGNRRCANDTNGTVRWL